MYTRRDRYSDTCPTTIQHLVSGNKTVIVDDFPVLFRVFIFSLQFYQDKKLKIYQGAKKTHFHIDLLLSSHWPVTVSCTLPCRFVPRKKVVQICTGHTKSPSVFIVYSLFTQKPKDNVSIPSSHIFIIAYNYSWPTVAIHTFTLLYFMLQTGSVLRVFEIWEGRLKVAQTP